MNYILKPQHGDSLAVPQLVISQLKNAEGDAVRVALYLLSGGSTDPKQIARDLLLKAPRTAENALQFWAGAGLLEKAQAEAAEPESAQEAAAPKIHKLDISNLRNPELANINEEITVAFGRTLSREELKKLGTLYGEELYQPDVIILCGHYVSKKERPSVGLLAGELARWRAAGVESGTDAERYLIRLEKRTEWEAQVAPLFGLKPENLTLAQKRNLVTWLEEWHFDLSMVREALVQAESKNTIRYVGGILRGWHAQGFTQPGEVRGSGVLKGSNISTTTTENTEASAAIRAVFNQDWLHAFDD